MDKLACIICRYRSIFVGLVNRMRDIARVFARIKTRLLHSVRNDSGGAQKTEIASPSSQGQTPRDCFALLAMTDTPRLLRRARNDARELVRNDSGGAQKTEIASPSSQGQIPRDCRVALKVFRTPRNGHNTQKVLLFLR